MHRLRRLKWCRKKSLRVWLGFDDKREEHTSFLRLRTRNRSTQFGTAPSLLQLSKLKKTNHKLQTFEPLFSNSKVRVTTLFSSHLTSIKLTTPTHKISTVTFENTTSEESCCVSEQHSCMKRGERERTPQSEEMGLRTDILTFSA